MRIVLAPIRWILGGLILAWEKLFPPTPVSRAPDAQSRIDAVTSRFKLYQFVSCPFCVKVRREITRLNLRIELRDARNDPKYRDELAREGGEIQVPCLKIEDPAARARWLYESDEIIRYLREQVTQA